MTTFADRLRVLEAELHDRGVPIRQVMVPGRSEGEIRDAVGEFGLAAPQELIDWWQWSDGFVYSTAPPVYGGVLPAGFESIGLEQAVQRRREDDIEGDLYGIRPGWLWIGDRDSNVMLFGHCGTATPLMRVCAFRVGDANTDEDLDLMTVPSLQTYVDWAIGAVRTGVWAPNEQGRWHITMGNTIPQPWR